MSYSGFMKGMATGMVLGAAATVMIEQPSAKQRKKMMKKTEGLFRNIGSAIDTAVGMRG